MRLCAKIIGAVLIIASCTGYGFALSFELKKRLNELREIKKIMFFLKGEIEYGLTPIFDAISEIAQRADGELKNVLLALIKEQNSSEDFAVIWERVMTKELVRTNLCNEEKERLTALSKSLGLPDKKMQQHAIDNYLDELNVSINTLTGELPKKVRLYRCLGLMCGIMITIIIV